MSNPQRAGRYLLQTTGYKAFIPEPLPPSPDIDYDGELRTALSNADRDIARLDAIAALLPNPDLFVAMYVKHEAVLSSQIEGTQSLSLIHISEPTRRTPISYAVFCLKKKK